MNKKQLHYYHQRFQLINAWYFLAVAVLFLVIAIYGLRHNFSTMTRLRQAVIVADQQNKDVAKPLNELRSFVYGHMNTNLATGNAPIKPPIQLEASYSRLVAAEKQRVQALNATVTQQADAACAQQFPGDGPNIPRISCVQQYVSTHAAKEQSIPAELYKFDFLSPRWSPDVAGFSLVFSAFFFFLFALRYGVERWYIRQIK
jgi:hypothetical protein